MDAMTVEYKSNSGMYIIRIAEKQYYYGNGDDINSIGISANQFLRFCPYLEYVKGKEIAIPSKIRSWIEVNASEQVHLPQSRV